MKKIILVAMILMAAVEVSAAYNDYTFSYWQNGWRKNANDLSDDLFGIETSQYGFVINIDNLTNVQFGLISNSVSYEQALERKGETLKRLPSGQFTIDLLVAGIEYRAKTCEAGLNKDVRRLSNAMLWESGRYVQHYDFVGLDFRNTKGQKLTCDAHLDMVACPGTLT